MEVLCYVIKEGLTGVISDPNDIQGKIRENSSSAEETCERKGPEVVKSLIYYKTVIGSLWLEHQDMSGGPTVGRTEVGGEVGGQAVIQGSLSQEEKLSFCSLYDVLVF